LKRKRNILLFADAHRISFTPMITSRGCQVVKNVFKKFFTSRLFLLGVALPIVAFCAPVMIFLFYVWSQFRNSIDL
jgi:ABC-type cobalamin transport system permease subunit